MKMVSKFIYSLVFEGKIDFIVDLKSGRRLTRYEQIKITRTTKCDNIYIAGGSLDV